MSDGAMVLMVVTLLGRAPEVIERREVTRVECEAKTTAMLNDSVWRTNCKRYSIECIPIQSRSRGGYPAAPYPLPSYSRGYRDGFSDGYQSGGPYRDPVPPPLPPPLPREWQPSAPTYGGVRR